MKIAYIISMANGMEPWIQREVSALQKLGLDVTLFITKYQRDPLYGPEAKQISFYKLMLAKLFVRLPHLMSNLFKLKYLRIALKTGTLKEFCLAIYFLPDMRGMQAKLIHAHFLDRKLTVGYYCAEMLGLPLTATAHAHDVYACLKPQMLKIALERSSKVFTVSDLTKKILVEKYGITEVKIFVSRLFVETADFAKAKDKISIAIAGRLDSQKGHRFLFDAVKGLKNPDIRIHVAGDGPFDVRRELTQSGLENEVIFWGRLDREQLRFLLLKSDIYCQPSILKEGIGEGIPVSLMEAMAAGLPVIATQTGAVDELVEKTLVPERNVGALAEAIRLLIAHPEERMRQGARNLEIVCEKYGQKNLSEFARALSEISSAAIAKNQ